MVACTLVNLEWHLNIILLMYCYALCAMTTDCYRVMKLTLDLYTNRTHMDYITTLITAHAPMIHK